MEYPRSTVIVCVLYTQGNSQKLAEWVKKRNFSTAAFRKGRGEGRQIPVQVATTETTQFLIQN